MKSNQLFYRSAGLAVLVLGMGLASGCNKNKNTVVSEATKNQILQMGNGAEPKDLDPHTVTGVPEHHILASLFEGLVEPDPKTLEPVPGVAESWTLSSDNKTYTFKINPKAKWSNGDKFTANDFVYSWQRALSPALANEYAYMLYYIDGAEDFNTGKTKDFSTVAVKALDELTLQVKLHHSTPFFLSVLMHHSTHPVHKATIEKFGKMDTRGTPWTRPGNIVGNGPFALDKWELNKIISVKKNPHYWDADKVKLNAINFLPIESDQAEERAFRAGELHVTNVIPINKIATYQKEQPEITHIDPYLGTYFYRINVTKAPLNNNLVRKALKLSLDRKQLTEKVTKGGEMPAYAFTPPGTAGYTSEAQITENIAEAKKLLAQAGYPDGKGLPTIEILYNTLESHRTIAEAVQQMWKKNLGIDVSLVNQDWKVYLDNTKKLNYQLSRAGWIGDYPDPTTFLDMWVTDGGNNTTGWSSKEYDALIRQAGQTQDHDERMKVFQKAEAILIEDGPVIPIYVYTRKYLKSPDLKGWYPNILDFHPYKHVYLSTEKDGVAVSQK